MLGKLKLQIPKAMCVYQWKAACRRPSSIYSKQQQQYPVHFVSTVSMVLISAHNKFALISTAIVNNLLGL